MSSADCVPSVSWAVQGVQTSGTVPEVLKTPHPLTSTRWNQAQQQWVVIFHPEPLLPKPSQAFWSFANSGLSLLLHCRSQMVFIGAKPTVSQLSSHSRKQWYSSWPGCASQGQGWKQKASVLHHSGGSKSLGLGGARDSGISAVFLSSRQRRVSESQLGLAYDSWLLEGKQKAGKWITCVQCSEVRS